jgi:hypothetical protein
VVFLPKLIFSGSDGGITLNHNEFGMLRQNLQKTQKQMASLLGTSLKAIQSFEQGWRKVPVHIERQLLFLMSTRQGIPGKSRPCWDVRDCPAEYRETCPAWEFKVGSLCWFINGTICHGKVQTNWARKMKVCQNCEVFIQTMKGRDGKPGKRGNIRRGRKSDRERNG